MSSSFMKFFFYISHTRADFFMKINIWKKLDLCEQLSIKVSLFLPLKS